MAEIDELDCAEPLVKQIQTCRVGHSGRRTDGRGAAASIRRTRTSRARQARELGLFHLDLGVCDPWWRPDIEVIRGVIRIVAAVINGDRLAARIEGAVRG